MKKERLELEKKTVSRGFYLPTVYGEDKFNTVKLLCMCVLEMQQVAELALKY